MIQTSIIQKKYYQINDIDQTEYSEIVFERKDKLEKYELLKAEGCSEDTILEVIGASRPTYFRWKSQYKLYGLAGLENESKSPNNKRKETWTKDIENKIYHLRKQYPVWGKAKIKVMYERQYNEKISESMVGRIIKKLIGKDKIYPVNFLLYKTIKKNRQFNGHAQRIKKGMKAVRPGELVQIDHMTINIGSIGEIKHFSAVCPVTKIAVERIYNSANSRNAADFLKHALLEFPFKIESIQVDGGGEFMKDFELLCQKLGIPLWVLPPRSPEANGTVERGNKTFKYEFYGQLKTVGNLDLLQKNLQKFVQFYNQKRPHQGIGLLTPYDFYGLIKKGPSVSYVVN